MCAPGQKYHQFVFPLIRVSNISKYRNNQNPINQFEETKSFIKIFHCKDRMYQKLPNFMQKFSVDIFSK